jgi:hypothetical protein
MDIESTTPERNTVTFSWIAKAQNYSKLFVLGPVILLSSALLASVCDDREYYRPLTDGDGIRYPLALSPTVWDVLGPIIPVRATDGRVHLAYPIQLTDKSPYPVTIYSFDVIDPDRNNEPTGVNQVVTVSNKDVTGLVQPFIRPNPLDDSSFGNDLGAGQAGTVYFDVTYPNRGDVPAHISHQLKAIGLGGSPPVVTKYSAIDEPITVSDRDPVVLSPPLRGRRWLVANACCKTITPHRGGLEPVNGQVRAPEMFSIDFVQIDAQGRNFSGNVQDLNSYPYYGSDVYSAASGKVVEVVRDLPNGTPGSDPAHPTADTAAGNHVIVDIGGGRYVMYAHLMPGSATVGVGDFVQIGTILGKLGDSGNSSAPHLHFQVMDRPSSLGAHGLPFVFGHMDREATVEGTVGDELDNLGAGKPLTFDQSAARHFDNTMPLTLDLLKFDF